MSAIAPDDVILVSTVVDVPRISDAERAELIRSLEQGRADMAAGNYDVVTPGLLMREFEAILAGLNDEEIDAQLGLTASLPR